MSTYVDISFKLKYKKKKSPKAIYHCHEILEREWFLFGSMLEVRYIVTASVNAENHPSLIAMAGESIYMNHSILSFSIPQYANTAILYSNVKFYVLIPNSINTITQSFFKAHCEQNLF